MKKYLLFFRDMVKKVRQTLCRHKNMEQIKYTSFLVRGNKVYERTSSIESDCEKCGYAHILELDGHYSRIYWDGYLDGKVIRRGRVVGNVKNEE